ncbi:hypothetical protein [Dyadobacter sp. CY323]|uniref:hypothetical protein n=1 Tax=Dyadobacter sp. CY323 TaxID=2907302 RepID=UPI001F37630F|nr:hypothetical protein [Dyadobacter sp. CY323]MCE6993177.1 hypothetical protein [Dyadobacter sp. CY323]
MNEPFLLICGVILIAILYIAFKPRKRDFGGLTLSPNMDLNGVVLETISPHIEIEKYHHETGSYTTYHGTSSSSTYKNYETSKTYKYQIKLVFKNNTRSNIDVQIFCNTHSNIVRDKDGTYISTHTYTPKGELRELPPNERGKIILEFSPSENREIILQQINTKPSKAGIPREFPVSIVIKKATNN